MDSFRQMALEIFGLRENFTREEVNKSFKRLSKIVHPDIGGDENLFKFIMFCKEVLLDNSKINDVKQTDEKPKTRQSKEDSKKESVYINLRDLYYIYNELYSHIKKCNIIEIRGTAQVFIIPCRNKKYRISKIIEFSQPFMEFLKLDFASFSTTVKLPENLKKFKKFKVRVEFMGQTFKFYLSMKNNFHTVKYKEPSFESIIELIFE